MKGIETYDFAGYATRNDMKCSDGRIIRKNAFASMDGKTVPLVWNHNHDDPDDVLGHALLKNRDDGVYAYCKFNDSDRANTVKELVKHGDITSLSIFANGLKQTSNKDVLHGIIREVSVVLAGANPGALIDTVGFAHSDNGDEYEEAIIYTGDELADMEYMQHSDQSDEDKNNKDTQDGGKKEMEDDKTVQEVLDTLNEDQKIAVAALLDAITETVEENQNGGTQMKHNAFDNEYDTTEQDGVLSHSAMCEIINTAKKERGSFKNALEDYMNENGIELAHAASDVGGFVQTSETGNVTELFPEYKDVRPGAPELIYYDQTWVDVVLNGVHKSPISRIRTRHNDIRQIEALRAAGYKKGARKHLNGNFKLATRTTDPQTIYVKNALHKDDINDITDFDYVDYLYNIDKMLLNEELATAIVFGDGRDDGDADKIEETHIRPIYLDDDLYTIHKTINMDTALASLQGTDTSQYFGDNYVFAEAVIEAALTARETYKGSGRLTALMEQHTVNRMLLARDRNGRRIYSTINELTAALNVDKIVTVETMSDKRRTANNKTYRPLIIMMNFSDYSVGSTKGGQVTHFTQFDIDFNQEKSLIETRCSGANTRVYSAIAIEEEVTVPSNGSGD